MTSCWLEASPAPTWAERTPVGWVPKPRESLDFYIARIAASTHPLRVAELLPQFPFEPGVCLSPLF